MKIKYTILLSILFFACSKNKNKYTSDKKTSDSVSYYIKLSDPQINSNVDKKLNATNKALNLVIRKENTITSRDQLSDILFKLYGQNQLDQFYKGSNVLVKNSLESKDTINLGKAYRCKAIYFNKKSVLDSSFVFYIKAEKIYFKLNDRLNYANILLNKGILQYSINDYLGAELSLNKALSIFKELNEKDKIYGTLNELGLVSNQLNQYDKAVEYHNQALKIVIDNRIENKTHQTAISYNNLGYLYIKKEEYSKAINKLELALRDKTIINDNSDLYANLIDNLAYSRLKLNKLQNPDLFFDALGIRKKINNYSGIIISYVHLSEYYKTNSNKILALKFSREAIRIAKESKATGDILASLKQASVVDDVNAKKYSEDYIRISDSLQVAERNSKDQFARLQLQTDEIIQEKDELQVKNRNLLLLFIGSSILFSLMYVIRHQRAKNRELLYKQAQQKANEDIYNLMISQQNKIDLERVKEKKRIAQDLHDGVLGRMFGTRLNLDTLNSRDDEEGKKSRLNFLSELKNIEQDIREISHDLNREKFVLINNFVAIVNNLLEEQSTSFPSKVVSTIDRKINWGDIANATKINLYRMLQESLQNVNKYASAKNIKVDIKKIEENIILSVADDGVGFIVTKKNKGIGLQNMISRTNECHGIFDIQSEKNKGTTITITIPTEIKTTPTHT